MPRHLPFVFVETNFLYELLRPEYAASKDVKFLCNNFEKKRIQIGIPNLCFKEAIGALRGAAIKDRLPESVTEFHRHFASLKKKKWDADQVAEFLKHNRHYHAQYLRKLDTKAETLRKHLRDSVIYPDSRFERILFQELAKLPMPKGLDEIILAQTLSAADQKKRRQKYFCSTDNDFAEEDRKGNSRPGMTKLYHSHDLRFVPSFGRLIAILMKQGCRLD